MLVVFGSSEMTASKASPWESADRIDNSSTAGVEKIAARHRPFSRS